MLFVLCMRTSAYVCCDMFVFSVHCFFAYVPFRSYVCKMFKSRSFALIDTSMYTLPGLNKWEFVGEKLRSFVDESKILDSTRVSLDDLYATHHYHFVNRFLTNELSYLEMKRIGFDWSVRALNRVSHTTGSTIQGARIVCKVVFPESGHTLNFLHLSSFSGSN